MISGDTLTYDWVPNQTFRFTPRERFFTKLGSSDCSKRGQAIKGFDLTFGAVNNSLSVAKFLTLDSINTF